LCTARDGRCMPAAARFSSAAGRCCSWRPRSPVFGLQLTQARPPRGIPQFPQSVQGFDVLKHSIGPGAISPDAGRRRLRESGKACTSLGAAAIGRPLPADQGRQTRRPRLRCARGSRSSTERPATRKLMSRGGTSTVSRGGPRASSHRLQRELVPGGFRAASGVLAGGWAAAGRRLPRPRRRTATSPARRAGARAD